MNPIAERDPQHLTRQVSASLNYLGEMHEKPFFHVHHRTRDNLNLVAHTVSISNARGCHPSLEAEGFCLLEHHASMYLGRRRAVVCNYGVETEHLIRRLTGASKVYAAPMGILRVVETSRTTMTVHRPVRFVHADCTGESAVRSLRRRFAIPQELQPGCRYVIYHVWRSLTPAPQDAPLALCDARTLKAQDCVAADTILDFPGSRPDRTEATVCRFSAEHRWYYFPDMTLDEVVVFKDFDSQLGYPSGVPHTAFDDPNCAPNVPARESHDLQVLAIF